LASPPVLVWARRERFLLLSADRGRAQMIVEEKRAGGVQIFHAKPTFHDLFSCSGDIRAERDGPDTHRRGTVELRRNPRVESDATASACGARM
jgi:hypothetical protein